MTNPDPKHNLAVNPAPQVSADVEYFSDKRIALDITNRLPQNILLEKVTLQFQTDTGSSSIYVDHQCGTDVAANGLASPVIAVTPTCQYREYTNAFRVMVCYRINENGRLGDEVSENHSGSYLIVRSPATTLGNVFISFKQLEDIALARTVERYARRAGLNPYLIVDDPEPGGRHWDRIEEAIKNAHTVVVIWNERTDWGDGVKKEIALCRKHGVHELLLLEQSLAVPELFRAAAKKNDYSRFHKENPAASLEGAVVAVRNRLLEKK